MAPERAARCLSVWVSDEKGGSLIQFCTLLQFSDNCDFLLEYVSEGDVLLFRCDFHLNLQRETFYFLRHKISLTATAKK